MKQGNNSQLLVKRVIGTLDNEVSSNSLLNAIKTVGWKKEVKPILGKFGFFFFF